MWITEEHLREAATELVNATLAKYPDDGVYDHCFSEEYEKKIKRVFRIARQKTNGYREFARRAACAVFALLTAAVICLAVNTNARAAFMDWILEQFKEFHHYVFTGEPVQESEKTAYSLSRMPDGYELLDIFQEPHGATAIYLNEKGQILQFVYTYGDDLSSMYATISEYTIHTITEADFQAEVILSRNAEEANMILWVSGDDSVTFAISAFAEEDDLISLAKSVSPDSGKK